MKRDLRRVGRLNCSFIAVCTRLLLCFFTFFLPSFALPNIPHTSAKCSLYFGFIFTCFLKPIINIERRDEHISSRTLFFLDQKLFSTFWVFVLSLVGQMFWMNFTQKKKNRNRNLKRDRPLKIALQFSYKHPDINENGSLCIHSCRMDSAFRWNYQINMEIMVENRIQS